MRAHREQGGDWAGTGTLGTRMCPRLGVGGGGTSLYDWIDYNGVAFSIVLLEWGHTFSDFLIAAVSGEG